MKAICQMSEDELLEHLRKLEANAVMLRTSRAWREYGQTAESCRNVAARLESIDAEKGKP